ncbi:MAG: MMPL family transporter [Planctomycetaceae bacterium]
MFILGMMVIGVVLAARQLPLIRLQNNLETWLDPDDEQAQALRRMESYFPKEERVVVSWDSSFLGDARNQTLQDLLTESIYFTRVRTAADLVQQITRWDVAESEAIRRLTGVVIGPQPSARTAAGADGAAANVSTLLTLSEAGIADPAAAIAAVRTAAVDSGIPASELHIDGALVTSLAVDREVWTATWNIVDPLRRPPVFAISAFTGIFMAFVVLRSVRVGLIVIVAAWWTSLVTTALMPATGHTMNMVTIVMPTLLVVLTVSAGIHIANYWRRAAATGSRHPIRDAVQMGWRPCLLASATTGVGLLSLAISRLSPIRDFGVFSTVGTMLSFVVAIVVFPALLWLTRVPPGKTVGERTVWRRVAEFVCRFRTVIVISSVVLGLSTGFGLQWLRTEVKVGRYFPDDSRLIQDSRFFERNVAGTSSVEVLVHFSGDYPSNISFLERMELIRGIEAALRQHPTVTGAISLADFQRVSKRPGPDEPTSARMRHTLQSRRTESKIKNDEVAASREYLAASASDGDKWTLQTPLDETWRITVQTLLGDDLDYGTLTRELSDIVRRSLGNTDGTWFDVTGSVPVFYRAQVALLNSLMRSLGLAYIVIAAAMMILLRSLPAGLMSSVPGVLPIAVVFGLMSWTGFVLDIGTMLTGSVAMGIAVDDMLHLLTWFRVSIREGKSQDEAVAQALHHCGPAMTQTTLVIALSLLLLYPADLLLISRFGWVMAALLGVAWVSSVLLLPALLAGSLGRMIGSERSG